MKHRFLCFVLGLTVLFSVSSAVAAEDTKVKGDKPAHVARGKEIALEDYAVPGKTTIFDFTSEYCPPCRAIAPRLEKLHLTREDIAVVKVDINRPGVKGIDWNSPIVRQYSIKSVPHFKVFGPDGQLLAEGDEASQMVRAWLK